jgi:hypothetical protein
MIRVGVRIRVRVSVRVSVSVRVRAMVGVGVRVRVTHSDTVRVWVRARVRAIMQWYILSGSGDCFECHLVRSQICFIRCLNPNSRVSPRLSVENGESGR